MCYGGIKMDKLISNADVIQMVINTLDSVEVHGKDNISKLLGCIQALESVIEQAEKEIQSEDGDN